MEALYAFTQVDQNRNIYDLMVRLESTANTDWTKEHRLTKQDYITLFHDEVCPLNDRSCYYDIAVAETPLSCIIPFYREL